MPRNGIGFGRDAFGRAPFGRAWWSRRVLWENIPEYDKLLDTQEGGGALEAFTRVMGDMLDMPRTMVRDFEHLRDARELRTKWNDRIVLTGVTYLFYGPEDTDDVDGRPYVTAMVTDGRDLLAANPEWAVDDGSTQYEIRVFRKQDDEFDFYVDSLPTVTALELRPPSLLGHLGADYGVKVDGHEPEINQRSSVYDYHKLLYWKGTKFGIEVRALMAGFTANVLSLYRIDSDAWIATLGADHVFEIPDGSGQWYTDTPPYSVLYDSTPADVIPTDQIGDCTDVDLQFADTIESVTGVVSAWDCVFTGPVSQVGSGYWYFVSDSDTAAEPTRYYAGGAAASSTEVQIISVTSPPIGPGVWHYYCTIETDCNYCKSYKLIIELEIADSALLSDARALESAFDRMESKVSKMLPAHVKVVQYTFSSSHSATMAMSGASQSQTLTFDQYDAVAADVQPADQFTVTEQ